MDGEVQVNMRQLYARAIAVVQSPGTGKSHMLTEVGLGFFAVTLCLKVPARLVKNYLLFQSAFMSQMLWAIQLQTGRFSTILRLCLRPTTVLQRMSPLHVFLLQHTQLCLSGCSKPNKTTHIWAHCSSLCNGMSLWNHREHAMAETNFLWKLLDRQMLQVFLFSVLASHSHCLSS